MTTNTPKVKAKSGIFASYTFADWVAFFTEVEKGVEWAIGVWKEMQTVPPGTDPTPAQWAAWDAAADLAHGELQAQADKVIRGG